VFGGCFALWGSLCGVGGCEPVLDCLRCSFGGVRFCDWDFGGEDVVVVGELEVVVGALAPAVASGDGGEGWESVMLRVLRGAGWGGVCGDDLQKRHVALGKAILG
jgi:hypothetical protein